MSLDCHCRGELALRHKECAIKWARVKGDTTCELCKHPVGNLPALPPRPPLPAAEPGAADEAYGEPVGEAGWQARSLPSKPAPPCCAVACRAAACSAARPAVALTAPPWPPFFCGTDQQYLMEFAPTYADLLFDCVRVCWVAMIVGERRRPCQASPRSHSPQPDAARPWRGLHSSANLPHLPAARSQASCSLS